VLANLPGEKGGCWFRKDTERKVADFWTPLEKVDKDSILKEKIAEVLGWMSDEEESASTCAGDGASSSAWNEEYNFDTWVDDDEDDELDDIWWEDLLRFSHVQFGTVMAGLPAKGTSTFAGPTDVKDLIEAEALRAVSNPKATDGYQHSRKPKKVVPTKEKYNPNKVEQKTDETFMEPYASMMLMTVLYAARVARFDLLKPVQFLAKRVTRWDHNCDRRLHLLMCYIKSTVDQYMFGWLGDDPADLTAHLFVDASFGDDPYTLKSTSGVHADIQGPNSRFPWAGGSNGQTRTAQSTPDAETDALNAGMKNKGEPALQIWPILLSFYHCKNKRADTKRWKNFLAQRDVRGRAPRKHGGNSMYQTAFPYSMEYDYTLEDVLDNMTDGINTSDHSIDSQANPGSTEEVAEGWRFHVVIHEDNTTTMQIVNSGKNKSMKTLERNAGISIGYLHERVLSGDYLLLHTRSCDMTADIYTKATRDVANWLRMKKLINVYSWEDIDRLNWNPTVVPYEGTDASSIPRQKNQQYWILMHGPGIGTDQRKPVKVKTPKTKKIVVKSVKHRSSPVMSTPSGVNITSVVGGGALPQPLHSQTYIAISDEKPIQELSVVDGARTPATIDDPPSRMREESLYVICEHLSSIDKEENVICCNCEFGMEYIPTKWMHLSKLGSEVKLEPSPGGTLQKFSVAKSKTTPIEQVRECSQLIKKEKFHNVNPQSDERWCVILLCTEAESYMQSTNLWPKNCTVVDVTERDDFNSPTGYQKVCDMIDKHYPFAALLVSFPCTGGCMWNIGINSKRSECQDKLNQHWKLFHRLWEQFELLLAKYGDTLSIAIEWPDSCTYWREHRVRRVLKRMKLVELHFHGCRFGLRSIRNPDLYLKKPWRIATNMRTFALWFTRKCQNDHNHDMTNSQNAVHSQYYTTAFTTFAHMAIFLQFYPHYIEGMLGRM